MGGPLSFVLIVGLSILGGWSVARAERCTAARFVTTGVVGFALLAVSAQALGTLAAIAKAPLVGPRSLVLSVLCLTSLVWVVVFVRGTRSSGRCGGWRGEGAPPADRAPGPSDGQARARWTAWAICALGLGVLANGAILGLSGPPRGWDVLTYHLPRAVAWIQHGNLGHYGFSPAFYPGNGEIAMMVTLFTGSDRVAPVVQLPFALLGAAALYGLAREIGARGRSALLAALAFLLTPVVVFQAGISKNDLIITGTILAGVYLLVRALGPRATAHKRRLGLVTGGLAFGLALGAKYTILPFVAATLPAVALSLVSLWGRDGTPGPGRPFAVAVRSPAAWSVALREVGLYVAALALPSAFWFAQNWIVTGNPFAPVLVRLGEWTVFEGMDVASTFGEQQLTYVLKPLGWLGFPWIDRAIVGRAVGAATKVVGTYTSSAGFGAVFAAFLVPAVGVLVTRVVRRRAGAVDPRRPMLLAFIVLGMAAWWLGGFHLPRYLWPALALVYAPMALLFDAVRGRVRTALIAIFVVAAAFSSLETVRIIHASGDFVSKRLPWGTTNQDYYHMPDLIYGLPAGTRILLYEPTDDTYHRTFRYPLIGNLPGNDVVMVDDVGVDIIPADEDTALHHQDIRREGIEYIFSRTLLSQPRHLWYDAFPNRYQPVLDVIERPYVWHRLGIVTVLESGALMGYPAVTKIYRVLGD